MWGICNIHHTSTTTCTCKQQCITSSYRLPIEALTTICIAVVRPQWSRCSSLGTFEWFCHCSPSLSLWASGDVTSEDRGTSLQYNCLWQASSHWCLPPKLSCQREIFCWNEHVVCENREHRGICTVALAWHVAKPISRFLSSFLPKARPAWA